jgi:hypothetical protein
VDGFWLVSSSWNITSEVREEKREKELHIKIKQETKMQF